MSPACGGGGWRPTPVDRFDTDQCQAQTGHALEQSVKLGLVPDHRLEHRIAMLVPQCRRTELASNQIGNFTLYLKPVGTSSHYVVTLAHRA